MLSLLGSGKTLGSTWRGRSYDGIFSFEFLGIDVRSRDT